MAEHKPVITLRIPQDLKDKVEEASKAHRVSMNSFILRVVGQAIEKYEAARESPNDVDYDPPTI